MKTTPMPAKILITPRALSRDGHPALSLLQDAGYELLFCTPGQTPAEEELLRLVPQCVGWLAGVEPVSAQVIAAATGLRAISRNGTGVDNLPMAALAAQNISVLRAEGANARGVAELAIGLLLCAMRRIAPINAGLKAGAWPRLLGREVESRTVALIGYGHIGKEFAKMACGLGAKVRAYDPFVAQPIRPIGDFSWYRKLDLLAGADVVSLHAPGQANGQALLGPAELASLAPGVIVINTARASLVDETAMLAALDAGQVGVYATDVFDAEPPAMSALILHPQVLTTSHIGGFTEESVTRATATAVENLLRVLGPANSLTPREVALA